MSSTFIKGRTPLLVLLYYTHIYMYTLLLYYTHTQKAQSAPSSKDAPLFLLRRTDPSTVVCSVREEYVQYHQSDYIEAVHCHPRLIIRKNRCYIYRKLVKREKVAIDIVSCKSQW